MSEVCANKYMFVWTKFVGKWEEKMFLNIPRGCQPVYDWHIDSFQGRNNYCKTDPDAAFMHMKDDHMRNGKTQFQTSYQQIKTFFLDFCIYRTRASLNHLI